MILRRGLAAAIFGLGLTGCDRADMVAQPKARTWDQSAAFADHATLRAPVPGTEPRAEPNLPVPQPTAITLPMVTRGRQRYDIFCAPCHGQTGEGVGMIVRRGFPPPPSLIEEGLVKASAAHLYDVITDGRGVMYGYAAQVPPADRWAIVAYIRALQLSRAAPAAALASADTAALGAGP